MTEVDLLTPSFVLHRMVYRMLLNLHPHFLHVLLPRLAFTFALSNDDDKDAIADAYSRKCTLWKNKIHWLMKSSS